MMFLDNNKVKTQKKTEKKALTHINNIFYVSIKYILENKKWKIFIHNFK